MSRFALVLAAALLVACQTSANGGSTISASYPEGPLFQGSKLYYAELGADAVTVVQDGKARRFFTQKGCGPTAIAPFGAEMLVLCHISKRVVSVISDGSEVNAWTADNAGVALLDPNDASADGGGGVYFSDPGTFSRDSEPEGRVMHLSADGVVRAVAGPLWYPNGVHVDRSARRVLVSEHLRGRVVSFDILVGGSLGPPVTVATLDDAPASKRYASPYRETGFDGLEIGPNGDLYVAVYGEGRIVRFDAAGKYRGQIELPTRYVTNIAFAPDGSFATTGAFDNTRTPFKGEVRFHAATAGE